DAISQFFHILNTVSNIKGTVHLGGGKYEYTIYTSCYDSSKGILYYTTYETGK
ncbi:MAG: linear amide C-N hydrolase, partial [Clostridia bacterium]|nr:linear amide C-N hydrolase [Clostridia bacterium]